MLAPAARRPPRPRLRPSGRGRLREDPRRREQRRGASLSESPSPSPAWSEPILQQTPGEGPVSTLSSVYTLLCYQARAAGHQSPDPRPLSLVNYNSGSAAAGDDGGQE